MTTRKPVSFHSSGNPFEDLGMADADIRLAKAQLALKITAVMREQGLTQTQVAEKLGIDQPQVSRIARGQLKSFSIDKLMELVKRLDQDIEISIRQNPEPTRPARLVVNANADSDDAIAAAGSSRLESARFD